jgi:hypothetical protein
MSTSDLQARECVDETRSVYRTNGAQLQFTHCHMLAAYVSVPHSLVINELVSRICFTRNH